MQARDSKRICAIVSLDGGLRTGVSVSVSLDEPETHNKECLLEVYIYAFQMRRLQFGASPFSCCDCFHQSGGTVGRTLFSSSGTYLHSSNIKLAKKYATKVLPAFLTFQTTKTQNVFCNVTNTSPNLIVHYVSLLIEFVLDVARHIAVTGNTYLSE